MSDTSPRTLDAWLRAAYADEEAGCPPPEAWLEAEMEGLSAADRKALDAHAGRCPACAAERDLARMFDAAPEEAEVRPEDLSFVVSRLEEAAPVRPAPPVGEPNVVAFPGPRRETREEAAPPSRSSRPSRSLLRFAAAAILVLGALLGYRAFQTPEPALPTPEENGVMRSSGVEILGPQGEVAEIPAELRWVPTVGAAFYRARIITVDDTVLWEGTALAPPARLPAEVAGRLHRAVLYTWTVEAMDAGGAPLAVSEPVQFRVKPAPGD